MDEYDCSLQDYLSNQNSSQWLTLRRRHAMLKKVLDIIQYIQDKGVCHLDLKPSNFLLNTDHNGNWNQTDFVLADFGIASSFKLATGYCGTPGFASPEQFIGEISEQSDNYTFGKLAVTILYPWDAAWNLLAQPLSLEELKQQPLYDTELWKLISALLEV